MKWCNSVNNCSEFSFVDWYINLVNFSGISGVSIFVHLISGVFSFWICRCFDCVQMTPFLKGNRQQEVEKPKQKKRHLQYALDLDQTWIKTSRSSIFHPSFETWICIFARGVSLVSQTQILVGQNLNVIWVERNRKITVARVSSVRIRTNNRLGLIFNWNLFHETTNKKVLTRTSMHKQHQ
jgi:hypothetical protein